MRAIDFSHKITPRYVILQKIKFFRRLSRKKYPFKNVFFSASIVGKTWNSFLQERHFSSILFLFCRAHSSAHSCVDLWYKNFPTIFYEFFNLENTPFFGRHVITFHRSSFKTYPNTGLEIKTPSFECRKNYFDCIDQ